MKPHVEITHHLSAINYTTTSKPKTKYNPRIEYINLPCGFDIETTSEYVAQDNVEPIKAAHMYIWQLGLGHDRPIYYGRTWEQLQTTLEFISVAWDLSESKRIVIYVHNLGYEFQFMQYYFNWVDIFAIDERKPIKAVCDLGIEFRCSYILSGFSLASTARNLTKHTIKKADGDLDYELIRHHETPLTPAEMGYCKADIEIVTAYIAEQLDYYGDIVKIPLTNTGRVRSYVRNECYYSSTNHRKTNQGKYSKYRKIMGDLTVQPELYPQLKRAFMGGFTHASAVKVNQVIPDVSSIDFTSSYPAVMCSERFPMSRFRAVKITSVEHFNDLCTKYALVFDIRFSNLRAKISQEVYLSESKTMELINPIIDNGRINSADIVSTTLTEVDYEIMQQVYEWDNIELANVFYAYKNYLPKAIVKSILDLYQGKTELKDVVGQEVEYLLSKGMLNSIYGMSVTDIVKDNAIYSGNQWHIEPVDLEGEIDKYNESKTRFLYYPWGLWVTAYARRNLWSGIIAVGSDYVYSDTDALKVENIENHSEYIKHFDNQMMNKLLSMCNYHKLDPELLTPKTNDGVTKPLGVWDFEGTYTRFKTLGAKRYLVQEGNNYYLTVAGLSKQNGVNYLIEQGNNDPDAIFELFSNNLYIPADRTGKMTHTYIDNTLEFISTDYLGNETKVVTTAGIHLEKQHYELKISNQYNEFLKNLSQGFIYRGITYA